MKEKGLYRSQNDKILGGVCSGIAEAINTETWIIRLVFILLTIFYGGGFIIYLILWIALPVNKTDFHSYKTYKMEEENNNTKNANEQNPFVFKQKKHNDNQGSLIAGIILITLGILFLFDRFVPQINFGDLWPILLIVLGAWLLRKSFPKTKKTEEDEL